MAVKAPWRLSSRLPCWTGAGRPRPGSAVGVPTQAWAHGAVGSPCTTSQSWSCIPALGGQELGAGHGGPSRAVEWGDPAPAPQLKEKQWQASSQAASWAGCPQTARAQGPQPFPGCGPQGMLLWPTLLSPPHRAHAKGSGVSSAFGAGTQQIMGTAVPRSCGHVAPDRPQQPPSPPASPSMTHSMGQRAPDREAPPTPQQPQSGRSRTSTHLHNCASESGEGSGGLPSGTPHPPLPRWAPGVGGAGHLASSIPCTAGPAASSCPTHHWTRTPRF